MSPARSRIGNVGVKVANARHANARQVGIACTRQNVKTVNHLILSCGTFGSVGRDGLPLLFGSFQGHAFKIEQAFGVALFVSQVLQIWMIAIAQKPSRD